MRSRKREHIRKTILSISMCMSLLLLTGWTLLLLRADLGYLPIVQISFVGLPLTALFFSGWAIACTIRYRHAAWIAFLLELVGPVTVGAVFLVGYYQKWSGDQGMKGIPFFVGGMACMAIGAVVSIVVGLVAQFEKTRVIPHLCRQCGYDIRFLPEPRCPECGTAFDPAQHQFLATNGAPVNKFDTQTDNL